VILIGPWHAEHVAYISFIFLLVVSSVLAATFSRHSSSSQSFMAEFSTPSLPSCLLHLNATMPTMLTTRRGRNCHIPQDRTRKKFFFPVTQKIIMLPCRWWKIVWSKGKFSSPPPPPPCQLRRYLLIYHYKRERRA
jgi:hypothetical protein